MGYDMYWHKAPERVEDVGMVWQRYGKEG